jgi:hypothetical protein
LLGAFVLVVVASVAAACVRPGAAPPATPPPTVVPGGVTTALVPARSPLDGPYPRYRDLLTGLVTVLGTPDLGMGRQQRISFVLSDDHDLVRLPALQYEVFRFAEGAGGPSGDAVSRGIAKFYAFPADSRGLYSATVDLLTPGTWGLRLQVPMPNGSVASTLFAFEVAARAKAPSVGDRAPRSRNRTLAEVGSVAELSTGSAPDRTLYERTIAQAIEARRPLILVFASPGFCTNALCGPQVEQLSELHRDYAGAASFIHVDIYENPAVVRERGLEAGVRTPLLQEWGLGTDEWTFVIDNDGVVAARFEGFAPRVEVEAALRAVLERVTPTPTPTAAPKGTTPVRTPTATATPVRTPTATPLPKGTPTPSATTVPAPTTSSGG